jgi:hypothetical protein
MLNPVGDAFDVRPSPSPSPCLVARIACSLNSEESTGRLAAPRVDLYVADLTCFLCTYHQHALTSNGCCPAPAHPRLRYQRDGLWT